MQFSQVPGYTEVKKALINAAQTGSTAHAMLFAGAEGTPALQLALAEAAYLNCTDRTDTDSCGICPGCSKTSKLVHPDLHLAFPTATNKTVTEKPVSEKFLPQFRNFVKEFPYGNAQDWAAFFGAENKQLNISVEESRNIIRGLSMKAFESEYKVMLLWLPELMNLQAANALLKMLEEPSAKTIFLLVSNDINRLMATIISRTQIFTLPPYTNNEMVALMRARGADEKNAARIARLSEGNVREALRLEADEGADSFPLFTRWMRTCFSRRFAELGELSDEFTKLGREGQKTMLHYTSTMIREALIWRMGVPELVRLPEEEAVFIEKFSPFVSMHNADDLYSLLNDAIFHIERNASARILFFDLSLKIGASLNSRAA
ncbi:MAG: DNA polymerase III subunit delta [Bacteroidota bacterium]